MVGGCAIPDYRARRTSACGAYSRSSMSDSQYSRELVLFHSFWVSMNGRSNVGILTLIVFQGLTQGCNQGSESPTGLSRMPLMCLQRNSRLQTLTLCSMVLIHLRAWNLCVIQLSFQMPKQALKWSPWHRMDIKYWSQYASFLYVLHILITTQHGKSVYRIQSACKAIPETGCQ